MASFLETLVKSLREQHGDAVSELCVVLPTQRAGLFLKRYLSNTFDKPIYAPEVLTIREFVEELSELHFIDSVSLIFEFYHVYREIEGDKAQDLNNFVKWAPALLRDFDEVDHYEVDARKLFAFVNETRAMEIWNADGSELTDFQLQYLSFWDSLGQWYFGLIDHLESRNLAFEGMAYRQLAQRLRMEPNEALAGHDWSRIVFAGFNALTTAEEGIVRALIDHGDADIFWDSDRYYMDNSAQEAGHFLRQYKNTWAPKPFNWVTDYMTTTAKDIKITGVPGNVLQAKSAGEYLSNLPDSGHSHQTAVVLASENLLLPMLQSLPKAVKNVNVTMGYPLRSAPIHGLWAAVFKMHENARRLDKTATLPNFYFRDVVKVLGHPGLRRLKGGFMLAQHLGRELRNANRVFLSRDELGSMVSEELSPVFARVACLFGPWHHRPAAAMEGIQEMIDHLRDSILEEREERPEAGTIDLEFLFQYVKSLKQIRELSNRYGSVDDLRTLETLFNQVVGGQSVSFFGEPLLGLQVMGMLETRLLDFENVVLLSANEDVLPAARNDSSFIPLEVRRTFNLPTHHEKDAIYAYHFYRLLQRAKNVHILYNTVPDTLGGGEKSRFLSQLLHELPKTNRKAVVQEQLLSMPVRQHEQFATSIGKSPEVLQLLREFMVTGISPSAINRFVKCPLDFYFKHVIRLPEPDEVEENIEASTFGTCVHAVLEKWYEPLIGKQLSAEHLKRMKQTVDFDTTAAFQEQFGAREITIGKNLLAIKVAIRFLSNFLEMEEKALNDIHQRGEKLTIVATEKELNVPVKLGEHEMLLTGHADRIDLVGDTLRIIDYKTGQVEPKDLSLEDLAELSEDPARGKAFQLLIYALLYGKENPEKPVAMEAGIISLRKLSEGFMPVKMNKSPQLGDDLLMGVEIQIKEVIDRMVDPTMPFEHQPESSWCHYC